MEKEYTHEAMNMVVSLSQIIIIKWSNALNTIEKYNYYKFKGGDTYHEEVKRAIYGLYNTIRVAYAKDHKEEEIEKIERSFEKDKCDDSVKAFFGIDEWLYKKGLTKFDNKVTYNRSIAEESNIFHGL